MEGRNRKLGKGKERMKERKRKRKGGKIKGEE